MRAPRGTSRAGLSTTVPSTSTPPASMVLTAISRLVERPWLTSRRSNRSFATGAFELMRCEEESKLTGGHMTERAHLELNKTTRRRILRLLRPVRTHEVFSCRFYPGRALPLCVRHPLRSSDSFWRDECPPQKS